MNTLNSKIMRAFCLGVIFALITVNLPTSVVLAAADKAVEVSPAGYLSPEGYLQVPEDFSGSFDLDGWQVSIHDQYGLHFQPEAVVANGVWSSLGGSGTGLSAGVFDIEFEGGVLYAGGEFLNAGGDPNADRIAKYQYGAWSSLGGSGNRLNDFVKDIEFEGGLLYAAGGFTDAGSDPNADYIAKFNGGSWSSLGGSGTGLNNIVSDIEFEAGVLYAGGNFTDAGGDTDADRIAMYSGGSWSSLGGTGTGLDNIVEDIEFEVGVLYAGGGFADAGGDPDADNIAMYSGGSWSSLGGSGTGLNSLVTELEFDNAVLYAGGLFTDAGGDTDADRIAMYSGGSWSSLGGTDTGLSDMVWEIEFEGGVLYAGGQFTDAGGDTDADGIARYSGGSWSSLGGAGTGLFSFPNDIEFEAGVLYAGGWFTDAGGDTDADWVARYGPVPEVSAITRADPDPTSAASVDFNLAFSEPVSGVDAASTFDDFALTTTGGISGASILAVGALGDGITASLLHMDGTDGSTTIVDETGKTWTANGSTEIDTGQSKFGGASLQFGGNYLTDYAETPDHVDFALGSEDFTIEFQVRISAFLPGEKAYFVNQRELSTNRGFSIEYYSGTLNFLYSTDGTTWEVEYFPWTPNLNTWYHVELVRHRSNLYAFINGDQRGTAGTMASHAIYDSTASLKLGSDALWSGLNGHIDEFRILKGIARHTAEFTPPSGPHVFCADTYTVTVDTGRGSGTIRLDVVDDDSIQTLSGVPLGGTGPGNGDYTGDESYTVIKPHQLADFDGNGTTDVSFYRPSTGEWFIKDQYTTTWGTSGDIPVPGDYDGNGSVDVAVFRPSTGKWFIKGQYSATYGTSTDVPVPGDYNGDGTTDIAIFRPATGKWFIKGQYAARWGTSADIPIPGDYNGDGVTDIAIYRPATGKWFIKGQYAATYGQSGDIPIPGDYDGDETWDVAIYRPSTNKWFIKGQYASTYGTSGDIAVPGDYDGNGTWDVALFRPSLGRWYIKGQYSAVYGASGDFPLPVRDTNADGDPYH